MASNKDILDAQRFNRRRLVTVFVTGAPGGRELEPRSMMRPLIGGIAVSLVILLVSWVSGLFVSSLPDNWENNTLVVVNDEGSRYLTINGRLRPVTNLASAMLLSEAGSFQQVSVDASVLDGIERGSKVGVDDAPEHLPEASRLVAQDWSACSAQDGSTMTYLGAAPTGLSDVQHALVSIGETTYLVADGVSHEIPAERLGTTLLALGLESEPVVAVDAAWLNLFTRGSRLEPFSVPGAGTPVDGLSSAILDPVAGMLLSVNDASGSERYYVVQQDGSLSRLSEVAVTMYQLGEGAGGSIQEVGVSDLTHVSTSGGAPADWPESLSTGVSGENTVCAVLNAASAAGPSQSTALASAETIASGGVSVTGGAGALVRAVSGGTIGPVFLITDAGRSWGLGGTLSDTVQRLGYTEDQIASVPSPWLALFPTGAELSPETVWEGVTEQ
ncbi:type VII secretion protein EccB [Actinomyces qiguomingii]|uniref:type VII secretion protein EccB n=1 Tax=Actinomyces qiguomingii TaxID=2057800 RepID=UPI000CA00536|nr:type VII secretion protein EccB [Actinomyces qiguomingii]